MIWKKSNDVNPPTQTPIQPPPQPSVPRSQPPSAKERALIGPSIKIEGNLSGGEDLLVEGRVKGKIDLNQHSITIGKQGRIKADIHGRSIIVMGEVDGNLYGSEQIILRKSSKVRGDLFAPRVSLEDEADFKGSIDMTVKSEVEAKPSHKEKPEAEAKTLPKAKPETEVKPSQKESPAVKPLSHQMPKQDKTGD
ncbi:MAG: polymer-forming cytoskeletal protein [Candidatus Aminicenantes bacterium]|jgi:cytoskeletal protein CcmA (bactofilin family)